MQDQQTFEIKLPQFEGPFDLLLFFIERDELDIHDIPISIITKDFLDYIHSMTQLNIEVASDFILVAATLMRIKAKMLLPRKELDEFGNEIDPRKELVDRLLEYKRYKEVITDLSSLEDGRQLKIQRGNITMEHELLAKKHSNEMELSSINLFVLLKVFQKVMDRLITSLRLKNTLCFLTTTLLKRKVLAFMLIVKAKKMFLLEKYLPVVKTVIRQFSVF